MTDHDFEAELHFLTPEEGGRQNTPVRGYRSDLRYPDYRGDEGIWMVWPLEFFTDEGDVPEGVNVPHHVFARFWIINKELRETIHRPRLKPGVRIEVVEGWKVVARGVVTRLASIADDKS